MSIILQGVNCHRKEGPGPPIAPHTTIHNSYFVRPDQGKKSFSGTCLQKKNKKWNISFLLLLHPNIEREDTNARRAIHAEERLAITLRFLATGNYVLFDDK